MYSERKVKLTLHLPQLEQGVRFESEAQTTTSRSRIPSINKAQQTEKRLHKHTVTEISSPNQLHLYTPKQESLRAKRLKNIPYQLQCFIPNLPNKNFKSSHLMSSKLLEIPKSTLYNKDKWQLNMHKTRMNNAFSLGQSKRIENQHIKTEQQEEHNQIRRQNTNYIEKEKIKRLNKQRIDTQKLIDQFASQFNSSVKLDHLE
ncbi:unnamed protein product [Paramecium pentaurelia]|uniref:Uncharacterized protein n=1 Tax=Paramecium pentaurelia TaxID=43138 RepID=A0A8S1S8N4_9CILI|nr:unnamed protein product [Paramecium pentaurelia]